MNRRRLLQTAAALLLAPSAAKLAPPAIAAPALEPVADGVLTATSDFQMFGEMGLVASGGLCAPVSPYYALTDLSTGRPIRDALPRLAAQRGGVRYETPEALS